MTWLANVARSGTATGASTFSAPVATAVSAGDTIVVVGFSVGSGCTIASLDVVNSSGTSKGETVTEITHYGNGASGNDARAWIITMAAGLATSDKLKVTATGTNFTSLTVWADSFSGAMTFEGTPVFAATASNNPQDIPSVTSTTAGTLWAWAGEFISSATSATVSGGGFTQTANFVTTSGSNSAIAMYRDTTAATTAGTSHITWNGTHSGVAIPISLIPSGSSTAVSASDSGTATATSDVSTGSGTAISGTDSATGSSATTIAPQGSVSANYAATILTSSPVGYWRLGDAAGSSTAADSSGNGHTLNVQNTVTFGQPGLIDGDTNTAARFNGAGYVTGSGSSFATSAFTVSAILDGTPQTSTIGIVVNETDPPHKRWGLYADAAGHVILELVDSAGTYNPFPSTGLVNDRRRHLVHATYGAGTWQIFIDGALDSSGSYSWVPYAVSGALSIGTQRGVAGTGWVGVIDEVAYYGTVLSSGTISAQWAAVAGAASGNADTATVTTIATVVATGGVEASDTATWDDTPTVIAIDDGPDATVTAVAAVTGAHAAADAATVTGTASVAASIPTSADQAFASATSQVTILGTNPSSGDLAQVVAVADVVKTGLIDATDSAFADGTSYVVEAGAPHNGVATVTIISRTGVVTFTSELT